MRAIDHDLQPFKILPLGETALHEFGVTAQHVFKPAGLAEIGGQRKLGIQILPQLFFDFDFNVIIRSLFYNSESQRLSYQSGGAITYDSIPESEWEEMRLKAWALCPLWVVTTQSSPLS